MDNLEPITPAEAVELYLENIEETHAHATINSHRSRLNYFKAWCNSEGIDNLNLLSGRDILHYRTWRKNDGGLAPDSLKSQLDTLRVFLDFTADIDGCRQELPDKIDTKRLSKKTKSRDDSLTRDRAEGMLQFVRKYHYGSIQHLILELLTHMGIRRGTARSFDIDDYYPEEGYIKAVHRPETDTPLKNGEDSERPIAVSDVVGTVIDDWIADKRPDVEGGYGRTPLLATDHGRIHRTTIQAHIYALTRPCVLTDECPHDRDKEECDAARRKEWAYECPSSVSTHAIRRGTLTHWLRQDVPDTTVSGRADVSPDVLHEHYDERKELEKMEQRRNQLSDVF